MAQTITFTDDEIQALAFISHTGQVPTWPRDYDRDGMELMRAWISAEDKINDAYAEQFFASSENAPG